ncbi:MAG: ParB/RepB/Spo0J family partition protein, partial [Terriglobales bacterium]
MVNASHAVTTEKPHIKTAEKAGEKLVEKRRALGRGLESLLPGPRVVAPPPPVAASPAAAAPSIVTEAASSGAAPADGRAISAAAPASTVIAHSAPTAPPVPTQVGEIRASGETADGELIYQVPINLIDHNPYQTRTRFKEEALQELADSIRAQGLIQPIVVRPGKEEGRFILILGERRLRASQMAGKETILAIVKRVSAQQAAEMTLVENVQRQDLNPLEQANAFANLSKDFHLTQEQIGERVGLSRGVVSNYMRLLS